MSESKDVQKPEEDSSHVDSIVRVLDLITQYGGIDGGHHKQWLLDKIVEILAVDYKQWVREYEDGEDGPNTYSWDVGIAP